MPNTWFAPVDASAAAQAEAGVPRAEAASDVYLHGFGLGWPWAVEAFRRRPLHI
jgi:hypothetical protein